MTVGHLDPPGVSNGSKDLGPVLVARWLVPPNPANLVAEPYREPLGRGLRGAAVHEHKFEAVVSASTGEVLKYQLNRSRLGRRRGNHSHAEGQARDVHADDSFGAVGSAIGTALVVECRASIGGPSREVRVYNHHRGQEVFSTEGGA